MAINLNDFINQVKRERRYGTYTAAAAVSSSDQPTLDILAEINIRITRIWGKCDWKWTREKLSFPIVVGTTQYQVKSSSGNLIDRILNIIPNDPTASPSVAEPPLAEMEYSDFYQMLSENPAIPDTPSKFINIGIDAAGYWNIVLWPSPARAFTMTGWAKPILSLYTMADVQANTAIRYFPNNIVLDVLLDGVTAGIKAIQGDEAGAMASDNLFEAKCKLLMKEQIGVARDNSPITTVPPKTYGNARRSPRSVWNDRE